MGHDERSDNANDKRRNESKQYGLAYRFLYRLASAPLHIIMWSNTTNKPIGTALEIKEEGL